jgi:hypothetical protein
VTLVLVTGGTFGPEQGYFAFAAYMLSLVMLACFYGLVIILSFSLSLMTWFFKDAVNSF